MLTREELEEKLVEALEYQAAWDSLGVYPMSINGVPRPEWQEGFNKCHSEMIHNAINIGKFRRELPADQRKALEALMIEDRIFFQLDGDKPYVFLNVNDTFCYAADFAMIPPEELPLLQEVYDKFDYTGAVALVSKKRNGLLPLDRGSFKDKTKFNEAVEYLKDRSVKPEEE